MKENCFFEDAYTFHGLQQAYNLQKFRKATMKTVQQLKSQIYSEVENSGFLKNIQSQVKTHVLQLIQKETKTNKDKLGFQYEHPVLKKLRNYPLTSLCMDLIQQFLESFKFKHTLNVFKKQINRDLTINRSHLTSQFSIDLSGKDQSVLLCIVGKIVNGDVKVIEKQRETAKEPSSFSKKNNNYVSDEFSQASSSAKREDPRSDPQKRGETTDAKREESRKPPEKENSKKGYEKYDVPDQKAQAAEKLKEDVRRQQQRKEELKKEEQRKKEEQARKQEERRKQEEALKQKERQEQEQKQKAGKKHKKNKKQEKKTPEDAKGLLADLVGKFAIPDNKKKQADEQFKARKAFSQQKQAKKLKPEQSGSNTIRGVSMGKIGGSSIGGLGSMSSFMKFSTFNSQPSKNEQIDQDFDELQQSKDSTRRNPLYSSSQSGFDKSNGYDQSVDSMAIEDYEYVEKARKFGKKP